MFRGLMIAGWLMTLAGCESVSDVPWELRFRDDVSASTASRIDVRIVRGDCSSADAIYSATLKGLVSPPRPPRLPPGDYAFSASALDSSCSWIARSCEGVRVPSSSPIRLMLETTTPTPACPADLCVASECQALSGAMPVVPVVDAGTSSDGARPMTDAAVTPPVAYCFSDDFDDGNANGWAFRNGSYGVETGRMGSGLGTATGAPWTAAGNAMATASGPFELSVDAYIKDASRGDLQLFVYDSNSQTFSPALHPIGSDDAEDFIQFYGNGVHLATAPDRLMAQKWHRITIRRDANGLFQILVDGAVHMEATPSGFAPPFRFEFAFYGSGVFDNIQLRCM